MNPRIALLYFSGTGGTKAAAELLAELLSSHSSVQVKDVTQHESVNALNDFDFFVFLYPTYFLRPAPSMSEFVSRLGPLSPPRPAYIVTTYELYSENSIRSLAMALEEKGIEHMGSIAFRSPGSDVTCLVPARAIPWLYRFERKFPMKLRKAAAEIGSLARELSPRAWIPRRKWYTPFAQMLQFLAFDGFKDWKDKYRVLPDRCTLCGACVTMCHRKAWVLSGAKLSHLAEKCELCTRCIHRCPSRAIVLLNRLKDNDRLDSSLYAELRADIRARL